MINEGELKAIKGFLNLLPVGIMLYRISNGEILLYNQNLNTIFKTDFGNFSDITSFNSHFRLFKNKEGLLPEGLEVNNFFEGNKEEGEEYEILLTGTEKKYLLISGVPIHNHENESNLALYIFQDITHQKENKLSLLNERNLMKVLIDTIPDIKYVKDLNSNYLPTNKDHDSHKAVSNKNELIGKSDKDIYDEKLYKRNKKEDGSSIKMKKKVIGVIENTDDASGNIQLLSTTKALLYNDGIESKKGIDPEIGDDISAAEQPKNATPEIEAKLKKLKSQYEEKIDNYRRVEEKFKIIVNNTGSIVYDYEPGFNNLLLYGNIKEITGYSFLEFEKIITSGKYENIIHPEDRQRYIDTHIEAKNKLTSFILNYRIQKKDENYIFVLDNGKYIKDINSHTNVIGTITDISEQKKAEYLLSKRERNTNLLREISIKASQAPNAEEVLNSVLESLCNYGSWVVGHAIVLQSSRNTKKSTSKWFFKSIPENRNFYNAVSMLTSPSLHQTHIDVIFSKKLAYINQLEKHKDFIIYNEAVKSGFSSLLIAPVFISGQVIALIEFYGTSVIDQDNLLSELIDQIGVQVGIMVERKWAEEELVKITMAIEQNHASVVISDVEGKIEYTNPKFTEVTGYTADEALGKKTSILKSGLHSPEFYKALWNTIHNGEIWQGEICNKAKNGQLFWEQVNISPLKNSKGEITNFVAVKDDITHRKWAEEELKLAKEAAEAANKAKSEFLANMSHEIRTPMNAILGFSELLSTKITDELLKNYVDSIKSSGKNLLTLINDVLDLSKIEAGRMVVHYEFIDPFLLFKDIEYMFQMKAHDKGLQFSIVTDLNLPIGIETDEVRLRQIMINLINNAIKFTDEGSVTVEVKSIGTLSSVDSELIDLQVKVIDTGIGISPDFLKIIFHPFTQQDGQSTKKYGGTGLGLSITKRLIELLNGTISVESKLGEGSCFTIVFHKVKSSRKRSANTELLTIDFSKIKFKPATIIIADDVDNNRKYFTSALRDTDLKIIESANGKETYDQALVLKPSLIITDLRMPIIDGFELVKKIKANPETKHIPVIATTASVRKEDRDRALIHNFDGILIKPIQINDLYLELVRILPHELLEEEMQKEYVDNVAISANADSDVKTVKMLLENDIRNIWITFENQQPLNEVENFANQIREIGKKYSMDILISYGNRLLSAINSFDIDKMLKTLRDYPKLLSTFKTIND